MIEQVTIAIPNYNRADMLLESFMQVYDDDRVEEIVISDDHSDIAIYNELEDLFKMMPKVRMKRNEQNMDCYRNKREAVAMANTEWVILLDSDNIIDKSYIDIVTMMGDVPTVIYTPSFAAPEFDFRAYEGILLNRQNISFYIDKPLVEVCLNACNYCVNKEEYLNIWDGSVDPVTSDSIFMATNWLEAGNSIYVVPELTYKHRVHGGSHYRNNVHRTAEGFHQSILNILKEMK